jgi:hypothetical protein
MPVCPFEQAWDELTKYASGLISDQCGSIVAGYLRSFLIAKSICRSGYRFKQMLILIG